MSSAVFLWRVRLASRCGLEYHERMRSEPAPEPDRTRTLVLTAGVLLAVASVWAVGLGIVDELQLRPEVTMENLPLASRAVRRPVVFAICPHRDAGEGLGVAIPIASIEPDGRFVSPLMAQGSEAERRADEGAFVATYCYQGASLRLLSGGAFAGTLTYGEPAVIGVGLPAVKVVANGTDGASLFERGREDMLGISDPRYGAAMSGARAMQADHRSAVEQLTRAALKERYPQWQIESADLARVRVADLDRTGEPEFLASRTVRLRGAEAAELSVSLFMIGEARDDASDAFQLAYVAAAETQPGGPAAAFFYVDQANLTPAVVDEVVVRSERGAATFYMILQRSAGRWREAFTSQPVTRP